MNAEIVHPRNLIPIHPGDTVIETISSFSIIILLLSHIAEIRGGFANMLMVRMGTGQRVPGKGSRMTYKSCPCVPVPG